MDNRQWRLARPVLTGERVSRSHFVFGVEAVPALESRQILVRSQVLSTSPAQRSYVSLSRSMHTKVGVGEVMRGRGIGVVSESTHPEFPVGTARSDGRSTRYSRRIRLPTASSWWKRLPIRCNRSRATWACWAVPARPLISACSTSVR